MGKSGRSFPKVSPRSFIKLLGAEYDLLERAGSDVLNRFYIAAILIFIIMITTFMSIHYAINLIFNVQAVEIVLSIFLSSLFGLIYILLINTFTKEKKGLKNEILNLSNVTRIAFVIFMGFIISKPIEIYFFENTISKDVQANKKNLLEGHIQKINELFKDDLTNLQTRRNTLLATSLLGEAKSIDDKINSISVRKKELILIAQNKIELSNFFIYQVKTVVKKYPLSWLLCFLMTLIFLLPGFLIYSISADASYFKLKKGYEKEIVGKAYTAFSKQYSLLFMENNGLHIEFYTKFNDPPFNTEPKESNKYKTSNDFHNKYNRD